MPSFDQLTIASGGGFDAPQVHVQQTRSQDFARLRFNAAGARMPAAALLIPAAQLMSSWDIAVGGPANVMNFFHQTTGNIVTLQPRTGNVGIGVEEPTTKLHVNGAVTVGILNITGGNDLAEPFRVDASAAVEPGTVLVIDERCPGRLRVSTLPYDRKVAGVVSGAGGVGPGITLASPGSEGEGVFLALMGQVYCKAEALAHPIEPGDVLVTSNLPGHAMKGTDKTASVGAVLGKAMSSLSEATGLVLLLVNLH